MTINHRFYNDTVLFSILSLQDNKTMLSFSFQEESNKFFHYKVKGNVEYSKKIVENIFKLFENIPVDSGDIDLCLRKTFSLRNINPYPLFCGKKSKC